MKPISLNYHVPGDSVLDFDWEISFYSVEHRDFEVSTTFVTTGNSWSMSFT